MVAYKEAITPYLRLKQKILLTNAPTYVMREVIVDASKSSIYSKTTKREVEPVYDKKVQNALYIIDQYIDVMYNYHLDGTPGFERKEIKPIKDAL